MGYKSEATTILLAFFLGAIGLCGIGHLYCGRLERGLVLFFAGLVLFISGFTLLWVDLAYGGIWTALSLIVDLGGLAFWIWQIFDARKVCRDHNFRLQRGVLP